MTLTKREFLGDMPGNKGYAVRQAYWWVFTHPGCLAGAVVEIRESRQHGATPRVRRYSVMEQTTPGETRVFVFSKPMREWRADEVKSYTVHYAAGAAARHRDCTCKSFARRGKCCHLEALLSLTNRTPAEVRPTDYLNKPLPALDPHKWEPVGRSWRCVACGMRAWNKDMVDAGPAKDCPGGREPVGPRPPVPAGTPPAADRGPPEAPGKAGKPPGKGKPHTPRRKPGNAR